MEEEIKIIEKLMLVIGHRIDGIKSISIKYEEINPGSIRPKIHIEFK